MIFNLYRGKLYHYILRIADSPEVAEDTVHDVFLKLWEIRDRLPDIRSLNAYLFRMAHNHAISGFRRMARETLILATLRNDNLAALEDVDILTQKEVRSFIQQAIDHLTPQQRKVFLLSRQEGLKHEAIAEKMGLSVNTVRAHLGEALKFLREEINKRYGPAAVAILIIYQIF